MSSNGKTSVRRGPSSALPQGEVALTADDIAGKTGRPRTRYSSVYFHSTRASSTTPVEVRYRKAASTLVFCAPRTARPPGPSAKKSVEPMNSKVRNGPARSGGPRRCPGSPKAFARRYGDLHHARQRVDALDLRGQQMVAGAGPYPGARGYPTRRRGRELPRARRGAGCTPRTRRADRTGRPAPGRHPTTGPPRAGAPSSMVMAASAAVSRQASTERVRVASHRLVPFHRERALRRNRGAGLGRGPEPVLDRLHRPFDVVVESVEQSPAVAGERDPALLIRAHHQMQAEPGFWRGAQPVKQHLAVRLRPGQVVQGLKNEQCVVVRRKLRLDQPDVTVPVKPHEVDVAPTPPA